MGDQMLNAVLTLAFMAILLTVFNVVTCRRHMRVAQDMDRALIRQAAQYSINASNTMNPILALEQTHKGIGFIESLHRRWGVAQSMEISGVDTMRMLNMLNEQQSDIVKKVNLRWPMYKVAHPLNHSAGMPVEEEGVEMEDIDADAID
jgi:hypothetical protein